jgi:fructan beta-fructosidase
LKEWIKESEFGENLGAHGGVWECPDLFTLNYKGQKIWVLVVNINPGGPNGGSATQYFTGSFDGHRFTRMIQTLNGWIMARTNMPASPGIIQAIVKSSWVG